MTEKIGFKIGHELPAVNAARDAVMALLEARADQKTIRVALKAFDRVMSMNGMTISNINLDMSEDNSVVHNSSGESDGAPDDDPAEPYINPLDHEQSK